MVRLHVLSGPDLGRSFEVEGGALLGRAAECQVVLRDPSVSRLHARLELREGRWTIVDQGSRNGVFVRGERVAQAALDDNEEFLLGEVHLRFRSGVPGAPAHSPSDTDERPARPGPPAPVAPPVARPVAPPAAMPVEPLVGPLPEEIVLEGAWDEPARGRAQRRAPPPPAAPQPLAPATVVARERQAARLAAAGLATPSGAARAVERRVLQHHRVGNRPGLLRADLAQLPAWARAVIALLALALFAALFLAAYRGVAWLRGAPPDAAAHEEGP